MIFLARIGLLLGICVTVALVLGTGSSAIFHLLVQIKWWIPWLIPLHALPLLLDVAGWRALLFTHCALPRLFSIAAVREAINRLLPVANIGGEVAGVHLLIRNGVAAPAAAASVVVETLLTLVSQCIFAAIGLVFLIKLAGLAPLASALLLAFALSLPLIFAFAMLLKHGSAFHHIERAAAGLWEGFSRDGLRFNGKAVDAAIGRLFASPRRMLRACVWQILGLLLGCTETWLLLRWLGHPVPAGAAIAFESLTQAARSIFFVIPSGLGIQEVGLIGLGRLMGIDAEIAVSLSLAKRLREILFGLPALGVWQWLEAQGSRTRLHDGAES